MRIEGILSTMFKIEIEPGPSHLGDENVHIQPLLVALDIILALDELGGD
jgi:hypothetical protein